MFGGDWDLTVYRNECDIVFGGDWILLNPFSYMTVHRSECEIVFGGDCFDQIVSYFDDHSSKSVAIWSNIGMSVK